MTFQRLGAAAALSATALLLAASPAGAAATEQATLVCGETELQVTGFGRGQVLRVVDSTERFVVTRAETVPETGPGTVVFDSPGRAGGDQVLSCTTVAPSGTRFLFEGFLTPAS